MHDDKMPDSTHGSAPDSGVPESVAALGGKVRKAVFWRTGTQIFAQLISWSATLIVIRLLNPADYGLFAMAQVMMTFLDFLNGYGFASALIQSKEVSKQAIRQALGLAILLNAGIAGLQFALAPHVAAYYGKPEVADLLRVLASAYLFTPFIIVPEVILSRSLEFRKQAIVNISAAMVGALASLLFALNGFGVWTLVYAPLCLIATRAIGFTVAAGVYVWPSFNFRGAGTIIKFGLAMMGSHLFWVMQSQSDIFIAGRRFDAHDVGLYAEALFLTQLVMAKFVPSLNQVAFPAYARMQDDPAAIRWSFLSAVSIIMLVTAPIYIGIAASAGPLIELLFGTKWLGMAPLVQILGIAMPFMTLQILFAPVNNAMGRPDISMKSSACGAVIFAIAFLVGSRFDIAGMTWAWLVAAPLLLWATIALSASVANAGVRDIAGAGLPGFASAMVMGAIVYLASTWLPADWPAFARFAILVSLGALIYGALSWWTQRATLLRAINLFRKRSDSAPVPAPA